jgi:hypothetical protein
MKMSKYDDCLLNFETLINSGDYLLLSPKGFTSKSNLSAIATTKLLKKKWFKLLEEYGKINELFEYVKTEFINYYNETGSSSIVDFEKNHSFITQDVVSFFGYTKIKNACGFTRKGLTSKDELIIKFKEVISTLGYVPNYSEFLNYSSLKPYQFISLLSDGTNKWDVVVKNVLNNNKEYEKYLKRTEEKRIQLAIHAKESIPVIPEEEIKEEFIRIFNDCNKKYGTYPTRRLFNILSKYSDGVYRKRYKESWNKTVERYGFNTNYQNPSEKFALGLISEITGIDYVPQKKWEWLISNIGTKLPVDGYYEELNLVVEFDGAQHRKPLVNMGGIEKYKTQVENDKIKDSKMIEHGIKLLRIDSRESWYDKDYMIDKLKENNIPTLTPTK